MKFPLIVFITDTYTWLGEPTSPQAIIGLAAILLGLFFSFCGEKVWQYLFAVLAGAVGACFVLYMDETIPEIVPGEIGNYCLATQVGLTLAIAAHMGFEGTQVIFGTLVGLAYAIATEPLVHSVKSKYTFFAWCCAGAALGVLCFTAFRSSILALLTPFFGGLFVVSGGFTVLAHLGVVGFLSPELIWIEALASHFGNGGTAILAGQILLVVLGAAAFKAKPDPKVGAAPLLIGIVFGALATSTGFGCSLLHNCPAWLEPVKAWQYPVLGNLAWLVLAGAGACVQLNMVEKEVKEKKGSSSKDGKDSKDKKKDSKKDNARQLERDNNHLNNTPETQGLLAPATDPHLGLGYDHGLDHGHGLVDHGHGLGGQFQTDLNLQAYGGYR
jgi:hypothetical protein